MTHKHNARSKRWLMKKANRIIQQNLSIPIPTACKYYMNAPYVVVRDTSKDIRKDFSEIVDYDHFQTDSNLRGLAKAIVFRNMVKQRDKYTCQSCGSNNDLHAHHIKPWATNPDLRFNLENGITLCKKCHGVKHGRMFT